VGGGEEQFEEGDVYLFLQNIRFSVIEIPPKIDFFPKFVNNNIFLLIRSIFSFLKFP